MNIEYSYILNDIKIYNYIYIICQKVEENIHFSLQEECKEEKNESIVTYEDLVKEVDLMEMTSSVAMDDYIALEIEYQTNYIKKELERIAAYYDISKRKETKGSVGRRDSYF